MKKQVKFQKFNSKFQAQKSKVAQNRWAASRWVLSAAQAWH
jgi:hypothetical protein